MKHSWKQEPQFRQIPQPHNCTEDILFCFAVRDDGKAFQSKRIVIWDDQEQIQKAKDETLQEVQDQLKEDMA